MNEKNTLTEKIMDTLEKKNISPKPRWEFMLKNGVLWAFGSISLLIGGIASALIIFALFNSDLLLYSYLSDSIYNHILHALPLIWIASFILFLIVAIYQIKHTKKGYRYSLTFVILSNFLASVVVGMILYNFGMAHVIDNKISQWVPIYRGVESQREDKWMQPDRGMIAGYITATSSESFSLRDFKGNDWDILNSNLSEIDIIVLNDFKEVGIFGEQISTSTFRACGVRPWDIKGGDAQLRQQMRNRTIAERGGSEMFEGEHIKGRQHTMMEDVPYDLRNKKEGLGSQRKLSELRDIKCSE